MSKHLAIITTHPIQYNAPFFRKLSEEDGISVKIFYTWDKGSGEKHDPGFGQKIEWDIPLLVGYNYTFVKNISKLPGSHHYRGIKNPTLINEIKTFQPEAILLYGWSFQSHLKVMRYFKGKVPVWFRGDSTLLDYEYQSLKDVFGKQKAEDRGQRTDYSFFSILPSVIYHLSSFLKFKLRQLFLTWVYCHVDKAFYAGTNNKEYFLFHGLKENQLVWLPHAVDNKFFQRNEVENEAKAKVWRKELGIKDEDFVVLFAGKFEPKKNPEILLRAVIELNEEVDKRQKSEVTSQAVENKKKIEVDHSQHSTVHGLEEDARSPHHLITSSRSSIHLIMVGNGILEPKLKEMTEGKSYIHFLPFQNQSKMPIVYRLGDVFCLPSQGPGETWGLAINEAMACGRPVIVSDKTGCACDLVYHNKTGYTFHHHSQSDLKNKIKASQVMDRNGTTKNCQAWIEKWEYIADPIIKTIYHP